jgi:hypothetical protein
MASTVPRKEKNSLTFESVVCTQLELQRRAASFSHRRNTMCRRSSQYRFSISSSSSNRIKLLTPISSQFSTSITSDIPTPFLKTRNFNYSKHSRTSSANSIVGTRVSNTPDRQSFLSMVYCDTSSRSATSKKVLEKFN